MHTLFGSKELAITTKSTDRTPNVSAIKRVAFIGNYLPRRCGIATFTTDLVEAMAQVWTRTDFLAVAMTDSEAGYAYPSRVRHELPQNDLAAYVRAADLLTASGVDVVCLQHEFGIFGGRAGSHVLALLDRLRMPVVATLHTVLRDPEPAQRRVMDALARRSSRLVVMSGRARRYVEAVYQVRGDKIDIIPHGVPDTPLLDPSFSKDRLGVAGKDVLLTFGLLSPDKGMEHVIRALPDIVPRHPNIVYVVLGDIHPGIRERQGDAYLVSLQRLACELGVEKHVLFDNRFVELHELIEYLGAADIYITPYLNRDRIVSGTLAYAVGMGKAVVSTPYWYAEELLAERRGRLVPFGDAHAIAAEVIDLLDNEAERQAMCKRAYMLGRRMTWPRVARKYMATFGRALARRPVRAQLPLGVEPTTWAARGAPSVQA